MNFKTIIISQIFLLVMANQVFAQNTIPNASFETWEKNTYKHTDWTVRIDEPTLWKNVQVTNTNAHSVGVDQGIQFVKDGLIALAITHDKTQRDPGVIESRFAYANRPVYMNFWSMTKGYNSKPFKVAVELFSKSGERIAYGEFQPDSGYFNSQQSDRFQERQVKLKYHTGQTPDSARITIHSALENQAPELGTIYFDNLSFSEEMADVEDELYLSNEVSIYPNPTNHGIRIRHGQELEIKAQKAIMINSQGAEFMVELVLSDNEDEPQLDFSNLPKGFYILLLETNKGQIRKEIIVQ